MGRYAYCESIQHFKEATENDFINEMIDGAKDLHLTPNDNEVESWKNNRGALLEILNNTNGQAYIAFEVICPGGGRIDCMFFGKDNRGKKQVLHIEMKQWDNYSVSSVRDYGDHQKGIVLARISETRIDHHAHPSKQAYAYQRRMLNLMPLFSDNNTELNGLAFCYNYRRSHRANALFDLHYSTYIKNCPLFCQDTLADLSAFVQEKLFNGCGKEVCDAFFNSPIRQTRFLIDTAFDAIHGRPEFVLIGDQLDAEAKVYAAIAEAKKDPSKKHVIIVKGGPGTGKTVIAMQILADLYNQDKDLQVYYTTRSSALRDTLRDKLGDAKDLIADIYSFNTTDKEEGEVDVLLVDEAHRIASSGNAYWYTSPRTGDKGRMTYLSQTMSLIFSSKVCVFFIDDHQAVKNTEIGTSRIINRIASNYNAEFEENYLRHLKDKRAAERKVARLKDGDKEELQKAQNNLEGYNRTSEKICPTVTKVVVSEIELTSQFRCSGSNNYLDWVDNVLYRSHSELERENIWLSGDYPFGVCDSPRELQKIILYYHSKGQNARLVAGWCWPWENGYDNGDLRKEVIIGDWKMPWETKNGVPRGHENDYAPSANLWASDPRGVNQIGGNPSSQGFEFDYVGVILGPDITYDKTNDCISIPPYRKGLTYGNVSGDNHDQIIRNIYRVLMTRGKKGCYIFCVDAPLNEYFKQLIKGSTLIDSFQTVARNKLLMQHRTIRSRRLARAFFGCSERIIAAIQAIFQDFYARTGGKRAVKIHASNCAVLT